MYILGFIYVLLNLFYYREAIPVVPNLWDKYQDKLTIPIEFYNSKDCLRILKVRASRTINKNVESNFLCGLSGLSKKHF